MSLFISLLISLTPLWAAQEACSTVDLGKSSSMALLPRWSQGESHLCYAYSAASLIDYYRFEHGDQDVTHITSPLLLSLKTIEKYQNSGSSFSGGKIEHAFATAKNQGSCGIQNISDKLGEATTDLILKTLAQHHQDAKDFPDKKNQIAESVRSFLEASKIKSEELPEVSEIEKNLSLSEAQFTTSTLLKYCGDPKKLDYLPRPKLLFQPSASSESIVQQVQNNLNLSTPVGINFCANVVTDPHHRGRMSGNKLLCTNNKNHSAIIVGQKTIQGKCHFLVQDTGCDGYKKSPDRCQNGQYWLDAGHLAQNLHGIFWLE